MSDGPAATGTTDEGVAAKCREANEGGDIVAAREFDSRLHLGVAEFTGTVELFRMLRTLDAKLQLVPLKSTRPTTSSRSASTSTWSSGISWNGTTCRRWILSWGVTSCTIPTSSRRGLPARRRRNP